MRAEIVLHQLDLFGAGKMHVGQFLQHLRVIGGGVAVGIPTGGAEGEELRGVGEVDDAAVGGVMGLAEERVAEILGRDQDPIGLELGDLAAQGLDALGGVLNFE